MVELESQQKITRRTVLQAGLAGAGTLVFASGMAHSTEERKLCRLDDGIRGLKDAADPVGLLKTEIAREHNVLAISTAEAYALMGVPVDQEKMVTEVRGLPPRKWTESTLKLLDNVLDIFPQEFTQPYQGERVNIAFDFLSNSTCLCAGTYKPDWFLKDTQLPEVVSDLLSRTMHIPDVIMIDPGYLMPIADEKANQLSVRVIGHELIHRYDMDVRTRQSWQQFSRTFGGHGFLQSAATIRDRIEKIGTEGLQPAEALAADRLLYGFDMEHDDFSEVVPSMGEVYFFGENFFNHGMSLYLGRETASSVYGILRDEIFCGKEYDAFPRICG